MCININVSGMTRDYIYKIHTSKPITSLKKDSMSNAMLHITQQHLFRVGGNQMYKSLHVCNLWIWSLVLAGMFYNISSHFCSTLINFTGKVLTAITSLVHTNHHPKHSLIMAH